MQHQHERAVAASFVDWYNARHSSKYAYHARGADPPDLVYRDGSCDMPLEITVAYYDDGNATMLWQNARGIPGAAESWSSYIPDLKLVGSIIASIEKKCRKTYPPGCLLIVNLYPELTSIEECQELLPHIRVPLSCPFAAVYLAGAFPVSSHGSLGGYSCWKLHPASPSVVDLGTELPPC